MSQVPHFVLIATGGLLFILLFVSFRQLCRSAVKQSHIIVLRITILIALLFEIVVVVLQLISTYYVTNTTTLQSLQHFVFWLLMPSLSFIVYKLVRTPPLYQRQKWSLILHRLWLCISVAHIIWILFCFSLGLMTNKMFFQNIYLFGFYIYIIFASIIILMILFHSYSLINASIDEINKSSSNTTKKQIDTVVAPIVTLLQLSKAKRIISLTVGIVISLIIVLLIAIFWMAVHFQSGIRSFYTQQLDLFAFHFLFSFSFYTAAIINHWISSSKNKQDIIAQCEKTESKKPSNQLPATIKYQQRTVEEIVVIDNKPREAIVINVAQLQPSLNDNKSKGNLSSLSPTLLSYTECTESKETFPNFELPLNRINYRGRVIGKRGMPKTNKLGKSQQCKGTKTAISIITEREEADKRPKAGKINFEPKRSHPFPSQITCWDSAFVLEDMLDTMSLSMDTTEITTFVFEFGQVLCTNIGKLHNKLDGVLGSMTLLQKQLCFGGADRLELISSFLKDLHGLNGTLCFIVTNELSKMVVGLLNDVGLLKYFISKNPNASNPNKVLSHVLGWDHKITKDSSAKKHLMLLKLLQSLQRTHDEMLYIGNNKDIIDHLNKIKICKTYLCETKGLTQTSMQEIFMLSA